MCATQKVVKVKQKALGVTQEAIKVIEIRQKKVYVAKLANTNEMNSALTILSDLSFLIKTVRTVELLKNLTTWQMIMKIFELLRNSV